ncbi:ubiquitin C-terminal hydrolase [Aspergillus luchuensis]|uniref:Ubiquitin C-terminal hydrolase n=1 Tax=Aspergillus kawachii TaxID=1069201 RepID=A0A146F748_ASPKA|nr:ubiquitin C-terminal hydrolase [Aspergillus luchuensis]
MEAERQAFAIGYPGPDGKKGRFPMDGARRCGLSKKTLWFGQDGEMGEEWVSYEAELRRKGPNM